MTNASPNDSLSSDHLDKQHAQRGEKFLLFGILVGIVVGITLGIFAPAWSAENMKLVGEIFLRMLKMLIVPLVMASMIVGVAHLGDVRKLGKLGGVAIAYYMTTTFIAVAIGMMLVTAVGPGRGYPLDEEAAKVAAAAKLEQRGGYEVGQAVEDILLSFFSPNIVKSMVDMDILPIIIFSLVFGGILTTFAGGRDLLKGFVSFNEAILRFVRLVMWFAPIGIMGLVAAKLGAAQAQGEFAAALASLGKYAATVISGLLIHGFIVLPLILFLLTRRNPLSFLISLAKPIMTAFGTSSSSATLPITMETLSDEGDVSKRSASFVAPLGATINMDGTALYEAVAVIFIAQAYQIPLGPVEFATIFFMATLAAIGAAGIPEAGLVTMILVLKATGLPIEGIGLILVIDWFLDRCRTAINVWGDCIGAAVVDKVVPPTAEELAD